VSLEKGVRLYRKTVARVILVLLVVSILSTSFRIQTVKADTTGHFISVIWHGQRNGYYCGPASLEMVFDYYGEDISQQQIAKVARSDLFGGTYPDDLRRAAQFSGYSARSYGYSASETTGSAAASRICRLS
jgi:hypothetical protein